MRCARLAGVGAGLVLAAAGCSGTASNGGSAPVTPDSLSAAADSIPEERPDPVVSSPPDSMTMVLSLLPAPPSSTLDADAAALAERAVFVPRTQRWFMAKQIDSVAGMDVGRIDGGVGTSESARAALQRMLDARSPVRPGMVFSMHTRTGTIATQVTRFQMSGRRILALLDARMLDSGERTLPIEWRGTPAVPVHAASAATCAPGDTAAIAAAVARFVPGPKEAISLLRGCFADFRVLLSIRPLEITPESIERVVLVRANGKTRGGRLRDLSYPLHELLGVTDVNGDGTNEIIVRSLRPAMETWAALRMTDSISFTRFASGFTLEKR